VIAAVSVIILCAEFAQVMRANVVSHTNPVWNGSDLDLSLAPLILSHFSGIIKIGSE